MALHLALCRAVLRLNSDFGLNKPHLAHIHLGEPSATGAGICPAKDIPAWVPIDPAPSRGAFLSPDASQKGLNAL